MQTELLFDPTAFRSHDWSDLVAADPAGTFFHTPAYLKLWWEEFGTGGLVVASVADRDRQVGACAFQVEEGLLAFLGGFDVTDYMGPVALAGSEEAVARELMGALSGEVEWDRADFRGLREGSAWAQALEGAAMSQGMVVSREQDGASPLLELPPS